MHLVQRSLWGLIWAVAIGIAIYLCKDMSAEQPALFALLLLCLLASSLALAAGRSLWSSGARGAAATAYWIGGICLVLSVISEISYWSGQIEGVHAQIQRERAQAEGRDLVSEQRRQKLRAKIGTMSPEEAAAQMQVELTQVVKGQTLAMATVNCSDTASPFFRYCGTYLGLKAQLAAAKELKELEGKVLADSTTVVSTKIQRSFYEAARIGSDLMGGELQTWIVGIVIVIMLVMNSVQVGALFVATAPMAGRREDAQVVAHAKQMQELKLEANEIQAQKGTGYEKPLELATAPKAEPATLPPLNLVEPILDDVLGSQEVRKASEDEVAALKEALAKFDAPKVEPKPLKLAEGPVTPPEPNGGTRIPLPKLVVDNDGDGEVEDISRFFDPPALTKAEVRGSRANKKKEVKSGTGDVETWAGLYMKPSMDQGDVVTSKDARDNYETWCKAHGLQPVHHKALTRKLNVLLGRGQGKGVRGPRNGNGTIFQGFFLVDPLQFEAKKRARA